MKSLYEVAANPSGFDSYSNYIGDRPDENWMVLLTRSRDFDVLTESNWESVLRELPETEGSVEVFRFLHWACGWWEALCVHKTSEHYPRALEIEESLESYLVLDEQDFCEKEQEEAQWIWTDYYDVFERIQYIRDNRYQFEFRSFADLLECVRGKYFAGYASELIHN